MWRRLQFVNSNICYIFGGEEGCDPISQSTHIQDVAARPSFAASLTPTLTSFWGKACGPQDDGSISQSWDNLLSEWFAASH